MDTAKPTPTKRIRHSDSIHSSPPEILPTLNSGIFCTESLEFSKQQITMLVKVNNSLQDSVSSLTTKLKIVTKKNQGDKRIYSSFTFVCVMTQIPKNPNA